MIAEALTDETTRKEAILRLRDSVKQRKTVVQTLEFAARVNREIGLGSEERVGGVTIIFQTNLKPGSLKRPAKDLASNVRVERRGRDRRDWREFENGRITAERLRLRRFALPFEALHQPS